MFSRNVEKYLGHLCDEGGFKMDMDDEITHGSMITHEGVILHKMVRQLLGL
jgi:NAD(P) transhydrogenase subunit alpha